MPGAGVCRAIARGGRSTIPWAEHGIDADSTEGLGGIGRLSRESSRLRGSSVFQSIERSRVSNRVRVGRDSGLAAAIDVARHLSTIPYVLLQHDTGWTRVTMAAI